MLESLNKYLSAIQGNQDIKSLFEPNGLKAEVGIHLVLNAYRKYAEACVEPLNFLRIAHELNSGVVNPVDNKKAQEIIYQFLNHKWATCLTVLTLTSET